MLLGARRLYVVGFLCAVSTLWLGCGDDDDAGLGDVGEGRALNSLDAMEWAAACGSAEDLVRELRDDDDVQRGLCVVATSLVTGALSGGDDNEIQQACQAAYDDCTATPQNPVSLGDSCSHSPAASCDITNGQLEGCLRALGDSLRALGRDYNCADPPGADGGMPTTAIDDACDIVYARCPELFDGHPQGDAGVPDGGGPSGSDGGR